MQAKKVIFTRGTLEEFKAPEHIKRARGDESGVRADVPLTLMRWIWATDADRRADGTRRGG